KRTLDRCGFLIADCGFSRGAFRERAKMQRFATFRRGVANLLHLLHPVRAEWFVSEMQHCNVFKQALHGSHDKRRQNTTSPSAFAVGVKVIRTTRVLTRFA